MGRRITGVALLTVLMMALVPAASATGGEVAAAVQHRVMRGLPADDGAEGLSEKVIAPIPFSLVGVSVPEGARVLLRTADSAGGWSPWMEAEPLGEDGPDPGSAESDGARPGWQRMSEPVWVGDAARVQLRVLGGDPTDVAVHLVDSLGLGRSPLQRLVDLWRATWRGTPTTAAQASSQPAIVTRAQWGADESLRGHEPHYSDSIRAGILHHTAGSNDYTREQAPGVVRAVYAYHTRSLGWSDIGYNLLVDRYGTLYEGRAGGLDRGVIGAHSGGFNTETFGISVLGTFMSGLPPAPALDAAVNAIAWKFGLHGINSDPNAMVDMASRGSTRYPEGHQARLHTLSGHRDVSTTACPGDALYAHMPELRHLVHAAAAPPPAAPAPAAPLLDLPFLPDLGLPVPGPRVPLSPPAAPPPVDALAPAQELIPPGVRTPGEAPRRALPLRGRHR